MNKWFGVVTLVIVIGSSTAVSLAQSGGGQGATGAATIPSSEVRTNQSSAQFNDAGRSGVRHFNERRSRRHMKSKPVQ